MKTTSCPGGVKQQGEHAVPDECFASICESARALIERLRDIASGSPHFEKTHVDDLEMRSESGLADRLMQQHPIEVNLGFEGNPGIAGGYWQSSVEKSDALVNINFTAGTVDLPLHVHEHSDRAIIVDAGVGLFHYSPRVGDAGELRSLIVQPRDILVFARGLVHTFTAPVTELKLLSYHAPFLELDDPRQFESPKSGPWVWLPSGLLASDANKKADSNAASKETEVSVRL